MNKTPIAVVLSDIHFNRPTLDLAIVSFKETINKATELNIPVIVAGDLNDTKDIIRGKVSNALISLLKDVKVPVYILIGNHDLLNEKESDHGLNFLRPYATIVDYPDSISLNGTQVYLIPYQSNTEILKECLKVPIKKSIVIMHQGFLGASMGDYVQDKSSISPDLVKDFTVISGHYHRHQTIGTVTYIGSPYTMTFGEANDGPKGFLILNSDGSFTREILPLRKHVILEATLTEDSLDFHTEPNFGSKDIIWLKITGPSSLLKKINKKRLGDRLFGHSNFKLDFIYLEDKVVKEDSKSNATPYELLQLLIDSTVETDTQKKYLKELSNEIISS